MLPLPSNYVCVSHAVWYVLLLCMQACSTRVCMITGDAEETAVAVASAVGLFDPSQHRTLSGAEIEHMAVSELEVMFDQLHNKVGR